MAQQKRKLENTGELAKSTPGIGPEQFRPPLAWGCIIVDM